MLNNGVRNEGNHCYVISTLQVRAEKAVILERILFVTEKVF